MFKRSRTTQVLFITALIILMGLSTCYGEVAGTKSPSSQISNVSLHGFNLTAWGKNEWGVDVPVDDALQFAFDEGANFLALDWAVNFNNDGTIVEQNDAGPLHPLFQDIKSVIDKAKAMGFYVLLKPHVAMASTAENRHSGNTHDEFKPANFFSDWKIYLTNLAKFATQNKVDAICIGTEQDNMDCRFRNEWTNLIDEVRLRFSGALTYDAGFNIWSPSKELNAVVFWDKLDFIGCSLYVPITEDDDASVGKLKIGWSNNSVGSIRNITNYLRNIANRYKKQLMALEGGYQSMNGGLINVNDSPNDSKVINNDLQSRGLEAYLSVLYENKGTWLKGISLWALGPTMMTPENLNTKWHTQGFTVYKKPAADVVKKYYKMP